MKAVTGTSVVFFFTQGGVVWLVFVSVGIFVFVFSFWMEWQYYIDPIVSVYIQRKAMQEKMWCDTGLIWKTYEHCLQCKFVGFGVTAVLYSPFVSMWGCDFSFSTACDKCEVCLSAIEQDLCINFQIKAQIRALLEYKSLNHYIRASIWSLLNLVLTVNKKLCCCCKIRSILDPWFIQFLHNHPSSLQISCWVFLSHWRENQSKLTSVTVKAVNIFSVKDRCQKRSGLGPKLGGFSPSFR